MPRFKKIPQENWPRARQMRKQPTEAEQVLWRALRSKQIGLKFRRQHPIGPFIADLFAFDCKLVIEIDGDTHADPDGIEYDQERTQYLESEGFKVIRFTNREVSENLAAVIEQIMSLVTPP